MLISAAAAMVWIAAPPLSPGATANVTVNNAVNGGFVPATTSINAGDTVVWTWPNGSFFHNVTSSSVPAAWTASATQNGPATFSLTFPNAGNYPYKCSVHLFTGSINVVAANLPPSVSITNPASGTVFSEPAEVNLQVNAADSDGSVTNVQFLVGASVLTNLPAPPFSAVAHGLSAGNYTLTAVASDDRGATAMNAINISVVTPLPLTLDTPVQLSPTSFQFRYAANPGLTYVVQLSTNLATAGWAGISTNKAAANPVIFVDTNAVANPGFYRVIRLPNP